jgi:putative ABC transport system permease protein
MTDRSHLRTADLPALAAIGLRTRPIRTALSALGIAIGVAATVAVLGLARSSQAELLAQIDRLGTNVLVVSSGSTLDGAETELPADAVARIGRVDGVDRVTPTAELPGVHVYRNDHVLPQQTGGMAVRAADASLLSTLDGSVRSGRFLDSAVGSYPSTVLGGTAATILGITDLDRPTLVWLGGRWFTVIGILDPLPLATEIDRSALVGFGVAADLFGYDRRPSRIYLRTAVDRVVPVHDLLAATVNPPHPEHVAVSRPSDVLTARAAAVSTLGALFLGLGAVALLVGAIGIANTMVISVLERRTEIGLRRALGARRSHVAAQFLGESLLLAAIGALGGLLVGTALTAALAATRGWVIQIPAEAPLIGLGSAVVTGALAGLYPALRAARLSPTDALRAG